MRSWGRGDSGSTSKNSGTKYMTDRESIDTTSGPGLSERIKELTSLICRDGRVTQGQVHALAKKMQYGPGPSTLANYLDINDLQLTKDESHTQHRKRMNRVVDGCIRTIKALNLPTTEKENRRW